MKSGFVGLTLTAAALWCLAGCTGAGSSGPGGLNPSPSPTPLAIEHLYQSYNSGGTGVIKIFDLPLTATSAAIGTLSPTGFSGGLFVDAGKRLFSTDGGGNRVSVFNPPFVSGSVPSFSLVTSTSTTAYDCAFDKQGDLLVSGIGPGSTTAIDAFTGSLSHSSTIAFSIKSGLSLPTKIAVDALGNLFVVNKGFFLKYTPPFSASSSPSAKVLTSNSLGGLKVDAAGNVYVGNATTQGTISVFSPPITNSSTPAFTFTANSSKTITDLAFDKAGNLYAGDFNGNIYVFTPPFSAGSSPSTTLVTGTAVVGLAIEP